MKEENEIKKTRLKDLTPPSSGASCASSPELVI